MENRVAYINIFMVIFVFSLLLGDESMLHKAKLALAEGGQALTREEEIALERVRELEEMIAHLAEQDTMIAATDDDSKTREREKQIQKKLDEEHQKSKDGDYHREFHDAIRKNGGERLKEEWKKNCNSRPSNKRELNCY